MDPVDWGAAEWSAFGQVGALVVATIVGAFVAVQVLQARRLREDQARPYVIVDFEFKSVFVYLTIKNIGATPAYNVRFAFEPTLELPGSERNPADFEIFRSPLPMVAPGRIIRVRYGDAREIFKDGADFQLNYRVQVAYGGHPNRKRSLGDPELVLDLLPYKGTIIGADHMAEIAGAVKGIDSSLKRWGGRDALRVRSTNQDRYTRKQIRINYWWSIRQITREHGWLGLVKWHLKQVKFRLNL